MRNDNTFTAEDEATYKGLGQRKAYNDQDRGDITRDHMKELSERIAISDTVSAQKRKKIFEWCKIDSPSPTKLRRFMAAGVVLSQTEPPDPKGKDVKEGLVGGVTPHDFRVAVYTWYAYKHRDKTLVDIGTGFQGMTEADVVEFVKKNHAENEADYAATGDGISEQAEKDGKKWSKEAEKAISLMLAVTEGTKIVQDDHLSRLKAAADVMPDHN